VLSACGGGGSGQGDAAPKTARIELTPTAHTIEVGNSRELTARALDAYGNVLVDRRIDWTSHNSAIATVDQNGRVEAVGEGDTMVFATSDGKSAQTLITVTRTAVATVDIDTEAASLLEGDSYQLTAVALDAAGRPLSGRGFVWSSSAGDVVSVDAAGKITALRPGIALIELRVEGKTDQVSVTVAADYTYDLLHDGWNGIAGESPELYRTDIRDPAGLSLPIAPTVAAFGPAPSPNGDLIAYTTYLNGVTHIYVMNHDGSQRRQLTNTSANDDQPTFSPDGTQIAFRRWPMSPTHGDSDIWVMDADGSNPRNLTSDHGTTNQETPAWFLDAEGSQRLVYSSRSNAMDGTTHLWSMTDDGAEKRQLTFGDVYDYEPSVSPLDGTVVFNRSNAESYQGLQLMSIDGSNVRPLLPTRLAFGQFGAAWSPDGRLIAFVSKHENGTSYQVYTVWADGTRLVKRTFDSTDKSRPNWLTRGF